VDQSLLERHVTSGAKSDARDAHVLAELVRTDRHHHRPIAGDRDLAEAIKALARAHLNLIWTRHRQAGQLRSTLREFYPGVLHAFDELTSRDTLAVLQIAPTPTRGRTLSQSKIASALRRAGRQRGIDARAEQIQSALREPQLAAAPVVEVAFGQTVAAIVAVLVQLTIQIEQLEQELNAHFERHPDAQILLSQPGLGPGSLGRWRRPGRPRL
jgi:transposase